MTTRPRGRPRAFDEGIVLDRALDAFWGAGYEATSLDDLAAATGLARASIYAAFSDKQSLYLKTLDRFSDRMRRQFQDSFAGGKQLVDVLTDFYLKAIALYFSGDHPRGCLVMCTAASPAGSHPHIREALLTTMQATEKAFIAAFSRAQSNEGTSLYADPSIRAELAAAALQSIALRARAGESRKLLENFAREAAAFLCDVHLGGGGSSARKRETRG